MTNRSRRSWYYSLMLGLTFAAAAGSAAASDGRTANAATSVATLSGSITDTRNLPVVGAVITARGSAIGWTATHADGSYTLTVPAGSYEILVRKGGYTPGTAVVVIGVEKRSLSLALTDANLSSVSVGTARLSASVPFNTGVSATATLSAAALSERPQLNLRDLALELPGVTLAHPDVVAPDTSFVVRGGTVETRVQIDGHAVSAGATGRWNSSYASQPLFDSIEVAKGAGLSGANAGESAFGTINLRTRDFVRGRHADIVLGSDGFGGSYSTFALAGSVLPADRLSYVFEHNVYGYNGPNSGHIVNNVVAEPNGAALLADRNALTSPFMLGSDLAKVRWRFTGSTSLTLGYVGIHGGYSSAGSAYGTYVGQRTIIGSGPNSSGGIDYSSPQYPGLVGTTAPAYTFAPDTTVQTNQPLFEAELRTAIRNDTLLVRPYVGTIYNVLDADSAAAANPVAGTAWSAVTTGSGCSMAQPCLIPDAVAPAFRQQEVDRLHGTTATLIHPIGDGSLNLSYDYRSDATTVATGNPAIRFTGTAASIGAYLITIPTTLARNFDWSATYSFPLTTRLRAFVGEYYTDWKLNYGTIRESVNFATGTARRTLGSGDRTYRHNDPHIGFTWRPQGDTSFRVTAGSALTVPFAVLVAGATSYSGAGTGSGVLSLKNPALKPESTVAYDLGIDRRLHHDTVASIDLFDNTIHNVFATEVTPFNGAILGLPPGSPLNSIFATTTEPLNAPIERNYGLEFALTRAPAHGLGYRLAATVQRAFLDELPPSFFFARSSFINGKQLDGSTAIPYTHAYGELAYRNPSGVDAFLSGDYTGTNNWTNGPAFLVWSTMLRYNLHTGYRAQFSIENLFNRNTGTQLANGVASAGFGEVNYGPTQAGGLPTYGATSTTRFAIPPRTFRLQVEAHM